MIKKRPPSGKATKAVELLKAGWSPTNVAHQIKVSYQTVYVWRLKYIIEPALSISEEEKQSAIRHAEELQTELTRIKSSVPEIEEMNGLREENTRLKARLLRYEDV